MAHTRGLVSTTQALRQIFLVPQTTPRVQFFRYCRIGTLPLPRLLHSNRRFRQHPRPPTNNEQIIDEAIEASYVQVVNDEGRLDPPERLQSVLRSLKRPDSFLLQVSPGTRDQPPVCKIMDRVALQEHERAQAKAARTAKTSLKQMELNWAIDAHDLSHRLKQLTTFIEKGRTVELILTRKMGKRRPTLEEVKGLMDKVLQAVKDANAIQVSPMKGEPGKHLVLAVKKKDS
ncbi:putative translation initiation factor IF3 [Aspergillus lucknowensis]|uniref:Translation initiation factor 3 N-terminal domain-containing protein n=1 Tax=Aspergillus lucknowensis TaxID=176173 RepID=A0ABR4LLI8_9EURO